MVVTTEICIRRIKDHETHLVNLFLENAGNSLESFRYFDKRPVSIISKHLITCLLLDNERPIGYGHLDREEDKIWLGIALKETEFSKGYGKVIMSFLFNYAIESGIAEIHLSVDKDNYAALNLYKGFDFKVVAELNNSILLMCKHIIHD